MPRRAGRGGAAAADPEALQPHRTQVSNFLGSLKFLSIAQIFQRCCCPSAFHPKGAVTLLKGREDSGEEA